MHSWLKMMHCASPLSFDSAIAGRAARDRARLARAITRSLTLFEVWWSKMRPELEQGVIIRSGPIEVRKHTAQNCASPYTYVYVLRVQYSYVTRCI